MEAETLGKAREVQGTHSFKYVVRLGLTKKATFEEGSKEAMGARKYVGM